MAQLAPIHVDQVYPGQPATLRFSAFPARTTPEFAGRVEQVSADALRDADRGLSWYQVEVSLGAPADVGGARAAEPGGLTLTPGMPVEIHIQTGERSPISYLAKAADRLFSPLPARRMNDAVLEVSLANELREIAGVAARIDEFCAAQKLIPSVAYAVNLAIDEILTNTISYGYDDDERHLIEIIVSLEADSMPW